MKKVILVLFSVIFIFPFFSFGETEQSIAKSGLTQELVNQLEPNRFLVEAFGRSSLAIATLNYERIFSDSYALGIGLGFNPAEHLRAGGFFKKGVMAIPVYFMVTPWQGSLRPFFTGGFNFQIAIGGNNRSEPQRTFIQEWLNKNEGDFDRILDQGPALMGGAGLEYKFVGDWLIRATGYGLYFMKSEVFAPWAGFSLGKQF